MGMLGLIEKQVERLLPKCPIGAQFWILVDPVDPISAEEDAKIRELGRKVRVPEIGAPKVLVDLDNQPDGRCDLCGKITQHKDAVNGRFRCPGCIPI